MKNVCFMLLLLLAVSCGGRWANNSESGTADPQVRKFELPAIPTIYQSPQERADYLAAHYWDKFDFSDTAYIKLPEITEQAFVDFIDLMPHVPAGQAEKAIKGMLDKAAKQPAVYSYFTEMYEKYLYEPNSPMRNEELYIPVLRHIIANGDLDELEKLRPQAQLDMALKNRVGSKANDVTFTLASGREMDLYSVKADYILLFLSNPDCQTCAELIEALQRSNIVTPLIESGKLKVVMVYPDEDLEAWRNHLDAVPRNWINGHDAAQSMRDDLIYDIKAIPSLYLLDGDKNVLIKDAAAVLPLENYFMSVSL